MDGGLGAAITAPDTLLENRKRAQAELIQKIYSLARKGVKRILVEAKTGFGKTHVFAQLALNSISRGNVVLFVTPRRRLTDQAFAVFSSYSESPVSYLMAGRPYNHKALVHVACDKTLNLRIKRARKSYQSNDLREFLRGAELPKFKVVMIDECHIGDATELMRAFPEAVFIGFSATPVKSDGSGLGDQYEDKVCGPTTKELIDLGLLLPVRVVHSDVEIEDDDDPVLLGNVVESWKEHAEGRQTVLYAKSLKHSQYLVQRFNEAGIPSEHVDYRVSDVPGEDGKSERDRIYDRLTSGETRVLCNYKLVRFGIDIPPVGCVQLANPSNNMVLGVTDYLQAVGRGRRPFGDQKDMILIDHTKTFGEHGHPDEEFDFPLNTTARETRERIRRKQKENEPPEVKKIKCKNCGFKYDAAPNCPRCGAESEFQRHEYVEELDVNLVEFGREHSERKRKVWSKGDSIRFCREVLGYYVGKNVKNVPAKIFYAQKDKEIPENARLTYSEIWKLEPLPCSTETREFLNNKRRQWFAIQSKKGKCQQKNVA